MNTEKPAHPEARVDEVFLQNCSSEAEYEYLKWAKRRGKIAYDEDGKVIPGSFPVFVLKTEMATRKARRMLRF